jgi:hypothetical protein
MMAARKTRDLCGDCHLDVRPTEYAPVATREGTCSRCGEDTYVVRSRIDPEQDPEEGPFDSHLRREMSK